MKWNLPWKGNCHRFYHWLLCCWRMVV